ncbi:hypothetical protein QYF61_018100 [Mycteria americana]|uniref:Uncharacterized protein n=1 Tax=Mycteria americana TaxID=33587 RepID=A0AAN7Q4Z9_MYCAM|nr:hypothetical protein QYF61_018100 [Mycteria americana]
MSFSRSLLLLGRGFEDDAADELVPRTGRSTPDVPHQGCVEGKGYVPPPAGNGLPNAAQEAVGGFCHKGTLLAHGQLAGNQDPQVLFCKAALKLVDPQPVLLPGIIPPQVQGFGLPFAELHKVPVSPFLQPVQVPLDGSMPICCTSCSSWFCIICKLAEWALCPNTETIIEDAKHHWEFSVVTLCGDVTVVVTLFSNVLPRSAVLRRCLRKLWIYCPPGQACEHRKALTSNFVTLQRNSRRSWAQQHGEKISPDVGNEGAGSPCDIANIPPVGKEVSPKQNRSHIRNSNDSPQGEKHGECFKGEELTVGPVHQGAGWVADDRGDAQGRLACQHPQEEPNQEAGS